jgi:L-fuculose-phosphate aldolase
MSPRGTQRGDERTLRQELLLAMQSMSERGLNRGTSGNASVRFGNRLLVTPSGVLPQALTAESMVLIDANGDAPPGAMRPSSEWRMHFGILAKRPDLSAVVHCHSRHATILACTGRSIPAIHYMVAVGGRAQIPIAPYRPFGSAELAEAVVETLAGGRACLMANHGQIAAAGSLMHALAIAEEVEEQAAVYWGALAVGGPQLLTDAQMDEVLRRFAQYGQRRDAKDDQPSVGE